MKCVQHRTLFMNSVTIRFILYCTVHCIFIFHNHMKLEIGLEPMTDWLQISCSTSWAKPANTNISQMPGTRKHLLSTVRRVEAVYLDGWRGVTHAKERKDIIMKRMIFTLHLCQLKWSHATKIGERKTLMSQEPFLFLRTIVLYHICGIRSMKRHNI